jgi:hypothetical protein
MNVMDYGMDPLAIQQIQNERDRALQDQLLQQSLSGAPAYSNRAALARVLQGVIAGRGVKDADQQALSISKQREDERQGEMTRIFDAASTETGRAGLAKLLAQSRNPALSQAGLSMILKGKDEKFGTEPRYDENGAYLVSESGTIKRINAGAAPKYHAVAPGSALVAEPRAGQSQAPTVATVPDKAPEGVRTLEAMLKAAGIDPSSDAGQALFKQAAMKAATHQPATSVTVDTGAKPMATAIGEGLGKDFESARQAAMAAQKSNQAASDAEALLNSGVYSGSGANLKLSGGKIVQAIGFTGDPKTVANTEALIANLSQQTLANIKQSGLGGGNGFSNADREFLQKAVGGNIEMTAQGMQKLIELNRRSNANITANFERMATELEKRPEYKGMPLRLGIEQRGQMSVEDALKKYP